VRLLGILGVLALAALGGWAYLDERNSRQADVQRLEQELGTVRSELGAARHDLTSARRDNSQLASRLRSVSTRLRSARLNLTPLATRIRRSVFTLKAAQDEGTGFAAWVSGGSTFVVTANHVVELSVLAGDPFVTLLQRKRSWRGRVVRLDPVNDLAVVLVAKRIAPPLWQRPRYHQPQAGDELLLVGSPLGYEGSVSVGIVSRVTRQELQTDVSAHPGVSGGPAVDVKGRVVGVLVSGEAETLNFAVPIGLACRRVRSCR
jgi:S1-C subfamily serine protease